MQAAERSIRFATLPVEESDQSNQSTMTNQNASWDSYPAAPPSRPPPMLGRTPALTTAPLPPNAREFFFLQHGDLLSRSVRSLSIICNHLTQHMPCLHKFLVRTFTCTIHYSYSPSKLAVVQCRIDFLQGRKCRGAICRSFARKEGNWKGECITAPQPTIAGWTIRSCSPACEQRVPQS